MHPDKNRFHERFIMLILDLNETDKSKLHTFIANISPSSTMSNQ